MKRSINVWMQLLGFEKKDPDRGASRFLSQAGFVPDSVCALLFHPDFVHLHRGMEKEYPLLPDNCAYRAIPRNKERVRQNWTNYDLRTLVAALKARGVDFYAGLMGTYTGDLYHREWLSEHAELRATSIRGPRDLMCLKRFADGSYYEDFFAEKLVQVLVDYDLAGIHLADGFCPSAHLYKSDYSTDMVEQFTAHTGVVLPENVATTMGDDTPPAASTRQAFLWGECRESWIAFWEWRWERFFQKICAAVHAVGKRVWVLGMYCSDPFETRYVYGFDTRRVMEAGVDAITANILPSSVYLENPDYPYYFHRMHMDLPLLRAQLGEHQILSMLNVQDASEEWSILEHTPVRLARDLYTMTAFFDGARPCADGLFLCLGDGIKREEWKKLKKQIDAGLAADAVHSYSPMLLWSDTAAERMLSTYIETRRPTAHKQAFEIFRAGQPLGGAVRSDAISEIRSPLFVPNYDLLSENEREALAAYPHPWIGTTPANYPILHVRPTYVCQDQYSDRPLKCFVCNVEISAALREEIDGLLSEDDGKRSLTNAPEREVHPPIEELPFAKLTDGFLRAMAALLGACVAADFPVCCNCPMLALRLQNGEDRLYLYNPYENGYVTAEVRADTPFEKVTVASTYPVLPVKFFGNEKAAGLFDFDSTDVDRRGFRVKLAPDGVTVLACVRGENSP
ncbi:MAG: hypothetical protein E7624_08940 [Ruminococcaceae bacterium]|nr:hypothetical protein [Oscillospiraceae bacterium]